MSSYTGNKYGLSEYELQSRLEQIFEQCGLNVTHRHKYDKYYSQVDIQVLHDDKLFLFELKVGDNLQAQDRGLGQLMRYRFELEQKGREVGFCFLVIESYSDWCMADKLLSHYGLDDRFGVLYIDPETYFMFEELKLFIQGGIVAKFFSVTG